MFYSISGEIVYKDAATVAVEVGGVAFKLSTSYNTSSKLGPVGSDAVLYTYLSVREDALELFGFATQNELDLFKSLLSVQNVGPKAALSILSVLTPEALLFAVVSGDTKTISKAQNVGAKTAQRIILELKDKFAKIIPTEMDASSVSVMPAAVSGNVPEAVAALTALGYSESEARRAFEGLDGNLPVEELIRLALKKMI